MEADKREGALKLLVVDDQLAVRKGLRKSIEDMQLGITEFFECESGEEAIHIALESHPDIILTDIMMGGMDGLKMVAALREELTPPPHIVFISAYDKFEFAKRAMDLKACSYLLKPVSSAELFQTLAEIKNEILSSRKGALLKEMQEQAYQCMLLYDYLTGKNHQLNVGQLCSGTGLSRLTYPLTLVIVGRTSEPAARLSENPLSGFRLHSLQDGEGYQFILFETPGEWIAVAAISQIEGVQLHSAAAVIARQAMPRCTNIGVSETSTGLYGLPALYRHAYIAWENGRFNGERIAYYERPEAPDIGAYRHLLLPVLNGDVQEARRQVDALFIQLKRDKMGREDILHIVRGIKSYLCVQIGGLTHALEQAGLEEESLSECDSHIRMKAQLMQVMSVACEIKNEPGGTPATVYEKIKEYIHAHYADDLSLNAIAEAFDMNYFYLSSMFKQHFGVTYSEYLAKVRLSNAEALLRTTGLMVYEVAKKVGYNDVKYFCRIFKKEYLETPERYRKSLHVSALSLAPGETDL